MSEKDPVWFGGFTYSELLSDYRIMDPEEMSKRLAALREAFFAERATKLRAYQVIGQLAGGEVKDYNVLEKKLLEDGYEFQRGISIVISEQDKNWVVPMAHKDGRTLGKYMQQIFNEWLNKFRPVSY